MFTPFNKTKKLNKDMFLKHKIQTSRQILDQYHIIFIGDVKKHYANNNFNVFNKLKIIILF
jgi:hypothetical protein